MSYRTAIPYCYRDPNGTYYFRLALNKELRILAPLLPKEVRLSLLTKKRQKAKELALLLAQALLSQQAVLVQMAKENASGKEILEQHLKGIEEHRHLIRMSAEDKLAYIPESMAKTVAEGLERESLKNSLLSIISDLEKELSDKKHGIMQRKRLKLALSKSSTSFDRDYEAYQAGQVTVKDEAFISELHKRVEEIKREQYASVSKSSTDITAITESLRNLLSAPATNTELPTYNPGGLSHEDMIKSFSDVWNIYIEEYAANNGDNTKLEKIKDCAEITKSIVRNTLSEDFRFFDLTPNQYLDICKKYVAIPAGIGVKKVTNLNPSEFLKMTRTPPKRYKSRKTIKDFLETFNSFIGKMNQRYRGKQSIDHVSVADILPAAHPDKGAKATDKAIKYFSDERIRDIFGHPYFSSPKPTQDTSHYRSGHFWIPLIGLFTGMRIGECSQLHTQDILQVHGVWCFWVNGDVGKRSDRRMGGKRVKTVSSIRYMPIHKTLLELGLLDYVTRMAELGSKVLFPTIDWGSTNDGKTDNYKNTAMRCFNQILKHNSAYQKGESFHLLRHTFITKMRVELDIPEHEIALYVGHLDQSEMAIKGRRLMTKHYGGQKGLTESELLKMRDIVNQIHFDLPLTREHWQNFSANKMRGIYTRVQLDKQLKREAESLEAAKARKAHKAASIAE